MKVFNQKFPGFMTIKVGLFSCVIHASALKPLMDEMEPLAVEARSLCFGVKTRAFSAADKAFGRVTGITWKLA